jgi:hypothetical protein
VVNKASKTRQAGQKAIHEKDAYKILDLQLAI